MEFTTLVVCLYGILIRKFIATLVFHRMVGGHDAEKLNGEWKDIAIISNVQLYDSSYYYMYSMLDVSICLTR